MTIAMEQHKLAAIMFTGTMNRRPLRHRVNLECVGSTALWISATRGALIVYLHPQGKAASSRRSPNSPCSLERVKPHREPRFQPLVKKVKNGGREK